MHLHGPFYEIRPVTEKDEAQIFEVYRQCEDFLALGPVANASQEMVRADLELSKSYGGFFCGIYRASDAKMMGIVDVVLSGWQGDPAAAYLSLLMIAAPYRSLGLGAGVVGLVEAAIFEQPQIRVIHSGVQVNNPGAIRFWQRMGYEIVSGPELMPDQTTVFHLEKKVKMCDNPFSLLTHHG